jgi:hypothetical protein
MNEWHYAVVAGINTYPGGFKKLSSARGDAERFADWVMAEAGGAVPEANVRRVTVTDDQFDSIDDARPTKREISDALRDVNDDLWKRLKGKEAQWANSRLYVYLSGHGIAPEPAEGALLMANANSADLGENLPCRKYMDYYLEAQTFHELAFFADCCRTEAPAAPAYGPTWTRSPRSMGDVITVTAFAAQYGTVAYEPATLDEIDPDDRRGFFTQAVLEGLRGEAADPDTRVVDSNTLAKYVRQRVVHLTKDKPHAQVPKLLADPATPIVFCRVSEIPVHAVVLRFPDISGPVSVHRASEVSIIASHDTGDGPLELSLPNGIYKVAPPDGNPPATWKTGGLFQVHGADLDVEI